MKRVQFGLETGEYALAAKAAEKIGLTVDEFAACCVQTLATTGVEKPVAKCSDSTMTPSSIQTPSWAEAIAIAKKRTGQK